MKKEIIKPWGNEIILTNDHVVGYCGKLLTCRDEIWSSGGKFHMHKEKDETFFVISGILRLEVWNPDTREVEVHVMIKYDTVRLKPYTWHRFRSTLRTECEFVEISTPDSPEDSYREWLEEIKTITYRQIDKLSPSEPSNAADTQIWDICTCGNFYTQHQMHMKECPKFVCG